MSFEIIPTPFFLKDAKQLVKKYPSLKNELAQMEDELLINPLMGEPLGKD